MNITPIIHRLNYILINDQSTKIFFKDVNFIYSTYQSKNLKRILCTSHFDTKHAVTKCRNPRCGTCDHITEGSKYDFNGKEFIVKTDMSCDTKNVLYVITCPGCNEYYIGETSNPLRARVRVHKQHINTPGYRQIPLKCPKGTFGENCTTRCPKNMYGDLCAERCDCKANQRCNHLHGCIFDSLGLCNKESYDEEVCCAGYFLVDGYCKACPPGKFYKNCSKDCPLGFYGFFCEQKCNCNETECDKALGCLKKDSKSLKTIGLIYWIIPVICGILIIILISICRRSQTSKHRHFVDIPTYQPDIQGSSHAEYDHMNDIIMVNNSNTVDNGKLVSTSSDTKTAGTGTSDVDSNPGIYHTLNLRVFDYEEPIKHEPLKRSHSENSSLYFECPARLMTSGIDINNVSNCKRGSSLRQIRSTNDHIHESDEQTLTRKRHFVPENYVSKSSESTFNDLDVINPITLEKKNMVPQSQLFLNELSSHLFNLQKY